MKEKTLSEKIIIGTLKREIDILGVDVLRFEDVADAVRRLKEWLFCYDRNVYEKELSVNEFIDETLRKVNSIFGSELAGGEE